MLCEEGIGRVIIQKGEMAMTKEHYEEVDEAVGRQQQQQQPGIERDMEPAPIFDNGVLKV